MSKLFGLNAFDFSDRARSLGLGHLALYEEDGRPRSAALPA